MAIGAGRVSDLNRLKPDLTANNRRGFLQGAERDGVIVRISREARLTCARLAISALDRFNSFMESMKNWGPIMQLGQS